VSSSRTSPCQTSLALLRPRLGTTIFCVEMAAAQTLPSTTSTSLEEPIALATSSLLETSSVFKIVSNQRNSIYNRKIILLDILDKTI
jgi:hypothetical protein